MKRFFIGVMLVVLMFVCAPTPASAVTIAELQAMIASLTAQLNILLAQQNSTPVNQIINPTSTSTGLVSFVEKPTLKLVYDSGRNESRLDATANVYVDAGANDLLMNYMSIFISDVNDKQVFTNKRSSEFVGVSNTSKELVPATYGSSNEAWRVKAGTRAVFKMKMTENPQAMFAGTYKGLLGPIGILNKSGEAVYDQLAYENTKSLPVTIVGEKSPYIESFGINGLNQIILKGARFGSDDRVYVNGVYKGRLSDVKLANPMGIITAQVGGIQTSPTTFQGSFPISWLAITPTGRGGCPVYGNIQIENSRYGKSNSFYVSKDCEAISTQSQINISWSNGNGNVKLGLINGGFEGNGGILGWISLNNNTNGTLNWDGKSVTDLNGGTVWPVSTFQGPFRVVAVSASPTGNYCTSSNSECNYVLSESFNITNSVVNIKLPLFNSTSQPSEIGSGVCYTNPAYTFSTNLTVGSMGNEVSRLKCFLGAKGFLSSSFMNNYFGSMTKAALAAYQASKGLSPADGYFGPTTRAAVNADINSIPVVRPAITVLYPNGGETLTLAKDTFLITFKPLIGKVNSVELIGSDGNVFNLGSFIGESADKQAVNIDTTYMSKLGVKMVHIKFVFV